MRTGSAVCLPQKKKKSITDVFIELAELPELRVRSNIVKLLGPVHINAEKIAGFHKKSLSDTKRL